jgi:hypothetical protein
MSVAKLFMDELFFAVKGRFSCTGVRMPVNARRGVAAEPTGRSLPD